MAEVATYPSMVDSGVAWIGPTPAHWSIVRLKHAVRRIVGGSTPASGEATYWDGDVTWITPTDMSNVERLSTSSRKITRSGLASCSAVVVPAGSLILSTRAPIGNVALADVELCTNQGCKALVPSDVLHPEFALRMFQVLKAELQSLGTGTTFDELSTAALGGLPIPVPPRTEQNAIVRFVDHADRRIRHAIRAKQTLIALLNEQKQAVIHRAVTRGLDPNVRLKPSGVPLLGDVPEHWDVRPAKYFFREVDERSESGTEELLSVSHLAGVTPRRERNVTMFMASSYVGQKTCRPGDLVINTMWAWMGALGVAGQRGIVSSAYGVYRPVKNSELIGEYAELLLRTTPYLGEYICRSTGIRSSRLRLYPDEFLAIKLISPPPAEQRAILEATAGSRATSAAGISRAEREIDLLREYRTRLIAHVVTGKLDVREAAARLPDEVDEPELLDDLDFEEADEPEIDDLEPVEA